MILIFAMFLVALRVLYSGAEIYFERDWPRSTWRGLLLSLILLGMCGSAFGQAVYISIPLQTYGPTVPVQGGPLPQALWVTNATVAVCAHVQPYTSQTYANCVANPLTTFTDAAESATCPSATPLVHLPGNTCVASAGVASSVDLWYQGGLFDYYLVSSYGTYGPYTSQTGTGTLSGCPASAASGCIILSSGQSIQAAFSAGYDIVLLGGGTYTWPSGGFPDQTSTSCLGWMTCQINATQAEMIGVNGGLSTSQQTSLQGVVLDFGGAANGLTINDVLNSKFSFTIQNTTGVDLTVLGSCPIRGNPASCASQPHLSNTNTKNFYNYLYCKGVNGQCLVLNGDDNLGKTDSVVTCGDGQASGGASFGNTYGPIFDDDSIGTYAMELTGGVDSNVFWGNINLREIAGAAITGYSASGGTLTLTTVNNNLAAGQTATFVAGGGDNLAALNGLSFTVLASPAPTLTSFAITTGAITGSGSSTSTAGTGTGGIAFGTTCPTSFGDVQANGFTGVVQVDGNNTGGNWVTDNYATGYMTIYYPAGDGLTASNAWVENGYGQWGGAWFNNIKDANLPTLSTFDFAWRRVASGITTEFDSYLETGGAGTTDDILFKWIDQGGGATTHAIRLYSNMNGGLQYLFADNAHYLTLKPVNLSATSNITLNFPTSLPGGASSDTVTTQLQWASNPGIGTTAPSQVNADVVQVVPAGTTALPITAQIEFDPLTGTNVLSSATGRIFKLDSGTLTNGTDSGTIAMNAINSIGQETLTPTNVTTYTNAASLYFAGPPIASTNATVTNPWTIYVASGKSYFNGATITGYGTTGTITGTALTASCDSGTASVTGAVAGHPVAVSSTTGADVGGSFDLRASVTSAGTVTVYVCGTGTPASLAYNVTVF